MIVHYAVLTAMSLMIATLILRAAGWPKPDHLGDYMHRWWLWGTREHKTKYRVRLHNIRRSDSDRDLHDHPWSYITIILWGGYWEWAEVSPAEYWRAAKRMPAWSPGYVAAKWYGPGSIVRRDTSHRHRLELKPGRRAWTLFITAPKSHDWGFYTKDGFVPQEQYEEIL